MNSDPMSYAAIILVIAVLVTGFIVWQKRRPKSRKPEQAIFLSVALLSAASVVWFIVVEADGYGATGVRLPTATYLRFAQTAGVGILFGGAYWVSKKKEHQERSSNDASHSKKNA